jgi:hypothetical protein
LDKNGRGLVLGSFKTPAPWIERSAPSRRHTSKIQMEVTMRQAACGMLIGAVALSASASIALAGEQHLEFKFVIKAIDPLVLQAANVDGQTMTATKAFGVAFFKDGRIAIKDFIGSSETRNGNGPMRGFSTYTFEDGSSITASYVGEYNNGVGKGSYTILSGTGIYANATGTGGFDAIPSKFKGASLLNGRFDVKTP